MVDDARARLLFVFALWAIFARYLEALHRKAEAKGEPLPDVVNDEQYWRHRERWHDQNGINRAEAKPDDK
jgi:hypothetical protein